MLDMGSCFAKCVAKYKPMREREPTRGILYHGTLCIQPPAGESFAILRPALTQSHVTFVHAKEKVVVSFWPPMTHFFGSKFGDFRRHSHWLGDTI